MYLYEDVEDCLVAPCNGISLRASLCVGGISALKLKPGSMFVVTENNRRYLEGLLYNKSILHVNMLLKYIIRHVN
jgi:hypothetical protein